MITFIKKWFVKLTEGIAALMLVAIFLSFLLQIFSRYVLRDPIGWTLELCLVLWVWSVFWGCSFILHHDEHVTFDLLYSKVRSTARKILGLIGAGVIVVGFSISFLPTLDYISFLEIRKSNMLRLPMDKVFGIYLIFIISTILIYGWRFIRILKNKKEII